METPPDKMTAAIANLDQELAYQLARSAVESGLDPLAATNAFSAGIRMVGDRFECGEIFLPELIYAGDIMKGVMAILEPALRSSGKAADEKATVVIGTVQGDLHNIGKSIVVVMLTAAGFRVVDLGVDVPDDEFIRRAHEEGAHIIALGAFMTTTRTHIPSTIARLKARGLRDRFRVMVGGAAVNRSFAEEVGADGFGENAIEALNMATALAAKLERNRGEDNAARS